MPFPPLFLNSRGRILSLLPSAMPLISSAPFLDEESILSIENGGIFLSLHAVAFPPSSKPHSDTLAGTSPPPGSRGYLRMPPFLSNRVAPVPRKDFLGFFGLSFPGVRLGNLASNLPVKYCRCISLPSSRCDALYFSDLPGFSVRKLHPSLRLQAAFSPQVSG